MAHEYLRERGNEPSLSERIKAIRVVIGKTERGDNMSVK